MALSGSSSVPGSGRGNTRRRIRLTVAWLVPVLLGAVVPVGFLVEEVIARDLLARANAAFLAQIANTLVLSAVATACVVGLGLAVATAARQGREAWLPGLTRVAGLGYALPGTVPPKPGLARVAEDGAEIIVELWDVPQARFGEFVAEIPPPLGIGNLQLADGRWVKGFICEPYALEGARDITGFGGWRAFIASQQG